MSQIGIRVKALRLGRGESQETVARHAGISVTTFVRIERGHNQPSMATLRAIAGALEVDAAELLLETADRAS